MLEITESLLRQDEQVWSDPAKLRDEGVHIAIDDFGTGCLSLSHLRQVSLDVVKIDRSFIRTLASSDQEVIAEGIETQREKDIRTEIGCPYGQGCLFSPPRDPDEAVKWLSAERSSA